MKTSVSFNVPGFSTRSVVFDHKVSQWRTEHFVPDRNEIAPVYRFRDKRHPGEPIKSRMAFRG